MEIKFLGQGFEEESPAAVGNYLIKFFSMKDYHTFVGISAFASSSGIKILSDSIIKAKSHLKRTDLIVGVDMKSTSKEALEEILNLDIRAFIFYTTSPPIFHPKIYLFEGEEKAELIIGSSNLTTRGLFQNVEASVLMNITKTNPSDFAFLDSMKSYFAGLFNLDDPNLQLLSLELINYLVEQRIVPLEKEQREMQEKVLEQIEDLENPVIKKFPYRRSPKTPVNLIKKRQRAAVAKPNPPVEVIPSEVGQISNKGILAWVRKKLPASSVQGGGSNTNPTGGLRLVQDDFVINNQRISQVTYFRNELFGKYEWIEIKKNPFVEKAIIPFQITIRNKVIGRFNLEVRHKPSGEAGQGNYTTSISWGEVGDKIKDANLIGARLELYSPADEQDAFQIIIS